MNARVKRIGMVSLALLMAGQFAAADDYGYEATSAEECTAEFPVYDQHEDGSAGCYREDTPALKEWAPGEFERLMLADPEYNVDETLQALGVTYEEAVAMGWLTPVAQTPERPAERPSLPSTGN